MTLSFHSSKSELNHLTNSVIIITGVGRSGKTLLGNLLGSCQGVEHLDEPWLPMILPILAGQGSMPQKLALEMFQTSVIELWYDRVLMRHANFRPADLSSIWRQKTPEEILDRVINLHSRDDVRRYTKEKRPILVLTLTDTLPYCDFLREALPGCLIMHVLREGLEVALAVEEKGWLSNQQLIQPANALPYRPYKQSTGTSTHYLPFWVDTGEEGQFLSFSDADRGLYYWRRLVSMSDSLNHEEIPDPLSVVKFADMIERPLETFRCITDSLGLTQTDLTKSFLTKVVSQKNTEGSTNPDSGFDLNNLYAAKQQYDRFDLPVDKLNRLTSRAVPPSHE